MAYKYSALDNKNLGWFPKDHTRQSLIAIKIVKGKVRGLSDLRIDFAYPITAIAGRNGSGKTTVLALAACAFHNENDGFHMPGRKNAYYTFSDFFIQTGQEASMTGIQVDYKILHNEWHSPGDPAGKVRAGWQSRIKRKGGKWTNYDSRVDRTVVYFGIDRIVPHAERSVARTYRKLFRLVTARGWEDEIKETVGKILGIDYGSFGHGQHTIYRIPIVTSGEITYSGFNMGAGEESLFELFSVIRECPDGSLIILDEIELGLHEDAQARLINALKALCEKRKLQVICTTHSPRILECLPPEGRIFLERIGATVNVVPGISPAYATGKLSGRPKAELDILVEDDTGKLIVENCLSVAERSRVRVLPVGSSAAVVRHLAVRFKEGADPEVCALLDGDMASRSGDLVKEFCKALETLDDPSFADKWIEKRLGFLPGTVWPEYWVVSQTGKASNERLGREFDISAQEVGEMLAAARRAGKHNEFYEAAKKVSHDRLIVAHQLVLAALESSPNERERIRQFISGFLG